MVIEKELEGGQSGPSGFLLLVCEGPNICTQEMNWEVLQLYPKLHKRHPGYFHNNRLPVHWPAV